MYDPTTGTLSKTSGLSIDEVRQCLGSSSRDLATLCKSSNINIWAKYKPVNKVGVITVTGRTSGSDYWHADDGKCGINYSVATSLGSLAAGFIHDLYNGLLGWSRASQNAPFRLLDFDGYDHHAVCPIGRPGSTVAFVDSDGNTQIDFEEIPLGIDTLNLRLSELSGDGGQSTFYDWYFSLLLVKGTSWIIASASSPMRQGSFTVQLTNMASYVGSYKMIPFMSSVQINQWGQQPAGLFCSIGGTSLYDVEIKRPTAVYRLEADALANPARTSVAINVYMISEGAAHTFNNIRVALIQSTRIDNPAQGTTLASINLGSGTAPAYGTAIKTGTIAYALPTTGFLWIAVYADGVSIAAYYAIEEDQSMEE